MFGTVVFLAALFILPTVITGNPFIGMTISFGIFALIGIVSLIVGAFGNDSEWD